MLIVQIIKKGKTKYHGCASVEVEKLDDEGRRRVKMRSSSFQKRICDLEVCDSVQVLNDSVLL